MSFSQLIKTAVSGAMKSLGDLAPSVTYRRVTPGTYDPQTGVINQTVQEYVVSAVLTSFSLNELDASIVVVTDMKCLIAASDLPIMPTEHDQIVAKGKTWEVIRLMGVPGDSLYKIHVREV